MGRVVGVLAALALLAGCTSQATRPTVDERPARPSTGPSAGASLTRGAAPACPAQLRARVRRAAGNRPVGVHVEATANLTVCRYRARDAGCATAAVTINTQPQAFVDFRRWVDESVQNAGTGRAGLAPVPVPGVGVLADWVPGTATFEAATQRRWITVVLTCRTGTAGIRQLATDLGRIAIGAR